MANKKRRFKGGEIPTSSMADIAFLLLIFFLVTTTIDTDKGLGIVLPPAGDVEIEIRKENILNCLINSRGKVLLDEEPTPAEQISKIVGRRLRENDKLIVSVKAHPKTPYMDYIRVIDQLKMADAKRISIANSE
ncbi:MAG: biopolymer transporter ExbD [Candidatus Neomarinimicrobiota bacterium]|nr:biopolymer transporter ExbD [Candidatus Neomarinimicrobiota bacterium]|tara:strand:- start:6504 stop:6905 length:402 start_codon:yes stop_codon:yes gene_type:complete